MSERDRGQAAVLVLVLAAVLFVSMSAALVFGETLAAGDFNRDGYAALVPMAIGVTTTATALLVTSSVSTDVSR